MKTTKKLLSMFMAVLMLTSIFAVSASAAVSIPNDAVTYNGHSYVVFDESITWTEAKSKCEKMGGYLAVITSENENNFIYTLIKDKTKKTYWIGLTDSANEGTFKWINNEKFLYSAWAYSQPDNNRDNIDEDYVEVYIENEKLVWNDNANDGARYNTPINHALFNHGYVCEWDTTTNSNTCSLCDAFISFLRNIWNWFISLFA